VNTRNRLCRSTSEAYCWHIKTAPESVVGATDLNPGPNRPHLSERGSAVSIMLPSESAENNHPRAPLASDLHPIDVGPHLAAFESGFDRSSEDQCWPWRGYRNRREYGLFQLPGGTALLAHRVAWVAWSGESLSGGLVIDHLCRNPSCVNPQHLEPVSLGENTRRRFSMHPESSHVEALIEKVKDGKRDHSGRLRKICPVCSIEFTGTYIRRHLRRVHLGGL